MGVRLGASTAYSSIGTEPVAGGWKAGKLGFEEMKSYDRLLDCVKVPWLPAKRPFISVEHPVSSGSMTSGTLWTCSRIARLRADSLHIQSLALAHHIRASTRRARSKGIGMNVLRTLFIVLRKKRYLICGFGMLCVYIAHDADGRVGLADQSVQRGLRLQCKPEACVRPMHPRASRVAIIVQLAPEWRSGDVHV